MGLNPSQPLLPLPRRELGSSSQQPGDVGALSLCGTEDTAGRLAPARALSTVVTLGLNRARAASPSEPEGIGFKSHISGFGFGWGRGPGQPGRLI